MKANIFYDYIVKGLNKRVEDQYIPKPVLVFVDDQKNHLTMRLSEYCEENNIIFHSHFIRLAANSVCKS